MAASDSNMSKLPTFDSAEQESEFWDTHDATDFLDQTVPTDERFEIARPSKNLISLRLDSATMDQLRSLAAELRLSDTALVRTWVLERLGKEQAARQKTADVA